MKLIDILVQELPKRGGWTEGAEFVAQDEGGTAWFFKNKPSIVDDEWWDSLTANGFFRRLKLLIEADDRATAIITREQYEAALKQPVWDGTGLPPVGVECEMANENGTYKHVKIIAIEDGFVIGWDNKRMITYISNSTVDFRPILTERDEAIHEIASMIGRGTFYEDAERIYDAGYRKQ